MPVLSDKAVAIGMPPISKPAKTSVPSGINFESWFAISFKRGGFDSNKYLSKYSFDTSPDLNLNSPVRWETL